MTSKEIANMLYKDSGMKGLSGLSGDMRELESAGTPEAEQAIDYFVFRIRRELGGLAASLSGLDAMVFCGGIGENSARIRSRICEDLHWIGLDVDDARNGRNETIISTGTSGAQIFVIKTDEEAMIARHTGISCKSRVGASKNIGRVPICCATLTGASVVRRWGCRRYFRAAVFSKLAAPIGFESRR